MNQLQKKSLYCEHPLLGTVKKSSKEEIEFIAECDPTSIPFLEDYRILGHLFFPGAGLIEIGLNAAKRYLNREAFQLEQMKIVTTLVLEKSSIRRIKTCVKKENKSSVISIYSIPKGAKEEQETEPILHGTFIISNNLDEPERYTSIMKSTVEKCKCTLNPSLFYQKLAAHKVSYGPTFQVLENIYFNLDQASGVLKDSDCLSPYLCHPTLIYGSFQLFTALLAKKAQETNYDFIYFPYAIEKISYFSTSKQPKFISIHLHTDTMKADIYLFNEDQEVTLAIRGFQFTRIPRSELSLLKNDNSEVVNKTARQGIAQHISAKLSQNQLTDDFFYDICAFIIISATRVLDAGQ